MDFNKPLKFMAERGRFELPVPFEYTRFPIVLLRPARTSLQTTCLLYQMKSEKSSEILKYFNFMWRTMKKLFSIVLILIALLQISLTSAFATASVSFEMQNADMKPNRLFSVALSANSGNRLSAATFEFTYDPDYIEFRKVKAVNNGSKIQVNKKSGKVKVVFLNSEGQNISGGSDVLTLDFKTIKEGTAYIDYTVNQCVDSDVNFMDVGSCAASCIRIYKNASGTVSGGSSSSSNKNSTQATGKGGKSKHPTEPTTVNASDDEYIDYNPIKDRQIKFFLAGMGITAGCLAILAVAYAIGKKSAQKKAEKEKNHNDNTLENRTSDD